MQVLSTVVVAQILDLWHAGAPKARIARDLAVDRKTVRRYCRAAESEGLRPGDGLVHDWAERIRAWFPEVTEPRRLQSTRSELERHRDRIAALAGMPVARMYRTLRDEAGLSVSLASFRRYLRSSERQPT
jgi:predicted transcriptional regulator